MSVKTNKPQSTLSRRKFLTIAGIATTAGIVSKQILATENNSAGLDLTSTPHLNETDQVPVNNIATILEIKTICI